MRSSSWRNSALGVSTSRTRVSESAISGWSTTWTATGMRRVCQSRAPRRRASRAVRAGQRVARLDDAVDDLAAARGTGRTRLHRVDGQPLEVARGPSRTPRASCSHLVGHRRVAHQPVVGVDRDPEPEAAQHADRVLGDRGAHAGAARSRWGTARAGSAGRARTRPAGRAARRPSAPVMSSTMRTPWPSRSAPQNCTASQIDGRPNASPAWMVAWKFSRCTYWNASRWRVGG